MRIVTCVKAVKSELADLSSSSDELLTLNPYDNFALKDAIRVKEQCFEKKEDCEIVCLTMGTMASQDVLTKCYAYGADRSVLLSDKRFGGADTVATTYAMQQYFQKTGIPSLIVCGQKSIDGETGQVVYGLARRLQIPCVVGVKNIVEITEEYAVLNVSDNHTSEEVKVSLPAVISYKEFTIKQSAFSLLKLKQAKRKEIEILDLDAIEASEEKCGIKGSKTKVNGIASNLTRKAEKQVVINGIEELDVVFELVDKYRIEGK